MDVPTAETPETPSRRRLLKALGGGALAAALAGCSSLVQDSYEFSADRVSLPSASRSDLGYQERRASTMSVTRSVSAAGTETEATVNSEVTIYGSEQESEPLDAAGLWQADDSVLAEWSGNVPVEGVPASAVTDSETLESQTDDLDAGPVPASAAQIWAPGPATGETEPSDLLVALPASAVDGDATGREQYAFDGADFLPEGVALAFEDGIHTAPWGEE